MQKDQIAAGFARLTQAVNTLANGSLPAGAMVMALKTASLPGYLRCDGAVVPAVLYPSLEGMCRKVGVVSGSEVASSAWSVTAHAFYTSSWSSHPPRDVVSKSAPNGWSALTQSAEMWLRLSSTIGPVRVEYYSFEPAWQGIAGWILRGSNDGVTWVVIDDRSAEPTRSQGSGLVSFQVANPGAYIHYRFSILTFNGGVVGIRYLSMYSSGSMSQGFKLPNSSADLGFFSQTHDYFIKY